MVYELGTDINHQWTFHKGDLQTITDNDNLKQAIYNRITTQDGTYQHFYNNYGSILNTYLGFKKNTTTLEFMKIELERVLLQDPRLQDFKLELDYDEKGVKVDLTINVDGTDMELNFITDGIIIEETE